MNSTVTATALTSSGRHWGRTDRHACSGSLQNPPTADPRSHTRRSTDALRLDRRAAVAKGSTAVGAARPLRRLDLAPSSTQGPCRLERAAAVWRSRVRSRVSTAAAGGSAARVSISAAPLDPLCANLQPRAETGKDPAPQDACCDAFAVENVPAGSEESPRNHERQPKLPRRQHARSPGLTGPPH